MASIEDKPVAKKKDGKMNTYPASILQGAQDYDSLMEQYQRMVNNGPNNPGLNSLMAQYGRMGSGLGASASTYNPTSVSSFAGQNTNTFNPYEAAQSGYSQSGDVTRSLGNLSELSDTGGYSAQGIADLRARGVSPIRAVYSNARQQVERNKSLQGGYSPNYAAAMAKMARELSEQTANATQNVNAGIAQNVASNRLSAAPQYAQASANANAAQTQSNQFNTNAINQANQYNAQGQNEANQYNAKIAAEVAMQNANVQNQAGQFNANAANQMKQFNVGNQQQAMGSLASIYQGQQQNQYAGLNAMTNLYGTTPANAQLYGQQAQQAAQLEEQKKARKQQGQMGLINAYQMR